MDTSKMTRQEIEALLRLLAEMERQEVVLLMQERREAERNLCGVFVRNDAVKLFLKDIEICHRLCLNLID